MAEHLQALRLCRRQRRLVVLRHQLREAQDAVQRCAQFVTDTRHEFALAAAGLFGIALVALQGIQRLPLGHIHAGADQPLLAVHRLQHELQRARAVRCVRVHNQRQAHAVFRQHGGQPQRAGCAPVGLDHQGHPGRRLDQMGGRGQTVVPASHGIKQQGAARHIELHHPDVGSGGGQLPALLARLQFGVDGGWRRLRPQQHIPVDAAAGRRVGQCAGVEAGPRAMAPPQPHGLVDRLGRCGDLSPVAFDAPQVLAMHTVDQRAGIGTQDRHRDATKANECAARIRDHPMPLVGAVQAHHQRRQLVEQGLQFRHRIAVATAAHRAGRTVTPVGNRGER